MNLFNRKASLVELISKGIEAKSLMDNPLVAGFFSEYEEQLVRAWKTSTPTPEGEEIRDEAYRMIGIIESFKARMKRYISSAESAKTRLEEVNKLLEAGKTDEEEPIGCSAF